MNKKVLISCLLMVFIFISSVSATEYNGTTQDTLDENNITFISYVSDTGDSDNNSDDLIDEKFKVKIHNPGSYQSGALGVLSLSTIAFGVFFLSALLI